MLLECNNRFPLKLANTIRMKKIIINLVQFLFIAVLIACCIALAVLFSPILLPFILCNQCKSIRFKIKYKEYLKSIDGTNFFCYTNQTNNQEFIEDKIIPALAPDVKIILLEDTADKFEFERKFIAKALTIIKDRKGFPYLLKVSNGQLMNRSINHDFYTLMTQNTGYPELKENINSFFYT